MSRSGQFSAAIGSKARSEHFLDVVWMSAITECLGCLDVCYHFFKYFLTGTGGWPVSSQVIKVRFFERWFDYCYLE